jgi:E3 ubiquitin-protein ligase BIG BROTHER-like protein
MAEEAMLSYHHHIQYLRESANELSQEDYDALQRALQEDVEEHQEANSILDNDDNDEENDDDDDDNNDGEVDLSYETMLYLSERIGDVKTERWTMISQREINKLPIFQYGDDTTTTTAKECGEENDSEHKCLICQCEYERGEELARLPCHHVFHKDCVAHWLSTKDVCPYCRQCIVPDKEQK